MGSISYRIVVLDDEPRYSAYSIVADGFPLTNAVRMYNRRGVGKKGVSRNWTIDGMKLLDEVYTVSELEGGRHSVFDRCS